MVSFSNLCNSIGCVKFRVDANLRVKKPSLFHVFRNRVPSIHVSVRNASVALCSFIHLRFFFFLEPVALRSSLSWLGVLTRGYRWASSRARRAGSRLVPSTNRGEIPNASRSRAFFSCCASATACVSRTLRNGTRHTKWRRRAAASIHSSECHVKLS